MRSHSQFHLGLALVFGAMAAVVAIFFLRKRAVFADRAIVIVWAIMVVMATATGIVHVAGMNFEF